MARQPQVTRTIQTTKVNVLCLNIKEGTPFTKEIIISRTYKDDKKLMKRVHELIDNEEVKAVHITDKKILNTLYGMSEQKFIENADILPPRNSEKTYSTSNE